MVSSRFEAGEGGTQGEADDDAYGDAGALKGGRGEGDPGGVDHGAGEAVFGGFVAELEDLGAGGVGLERVWSRTAARFAGEERVWAAKAAASKCGHVRDQGVRYSDAVQEDSFGVGRCAGYFLSYRGQTLGGRYHFMASPMYFIESVLL